MWEKAKAANLVSGVCKACSNKMGTLDSAVNQGLSLLEDIGGHPSMAKFQEQGYEVITFFSYSLDYLSWSDPKSVFFSGIWSMMYSERAVIVKLGFTPRFAGTTEPSATKRFG